MIATFRHNVDFAGLRKEYERSSKRSLFRIGSVTRRRIRQTVRRRKNPAAVGKPPSAHRTGGGGLKYVLFAVNAIRGNVIMGPARTPSKGSRPAPGVQEGGGVTYIQTKDGIKRFNIGEHPFVGPAFKAVQPRYPYIVARAYQYRGRR